MTSVPILGKVGSVVLPGALDRILVSARGFAHPLYYDGRGGSTERKHLGSCGTAGAATGSRSPVREGLFADFAGLVLEEDLTAGLKESSLLSGQQEVVIGSPTSNRGRSDIEELIGFFVNTPA